MAKNNVTLRLFGVNIVVKVADEPCEEKRIRERDEEIVVKVVDEPCEEERVQERDQGIVVKVERDQETVVKVERDQEIVVKVADEPCEEERVQKRDQEIVVKVERDQEIVVKVADEPCEEEHVQERVQESAKLCSVDEQVVITSSNPSIVREKCGKRKHDNVDGGDKKRRTRNKRHGYDSGPILSLEEIPGLLQAIEARNGTGPVFLYGKKLEESDVRRDQNRLFVTNRDRLVEFLNNDEFAKLDEGMEVVGVDPQGKVYGLGLKIWKSLDQIVVNSDWSKLVRENCAEKGDWVQMWGYREKEKLCFGFNFPKHENSNSSSSTNCKGTSKVSIE